MIMMRRTQRRTKQTTIRLWIRHLKTNWHCKAHLSALQLHPALSYACLALAGGNALIGSGIAELPLHNPQPYLPQHPFLSQLARSELSNIERDSLLHGSHNGANSGAPIDHSNQENVRSRRFLSVCVCVFLWGVPWVRGWVRTYRHYITLHYSTTLDHTQVTLHYIHIQSNRLRYTQSHTRRYTRNYI